MKTGSLYCITCNINKKKYIGITYRTVGVRWSQHKQATKDPILSERPLYRAMNKYGIENFPMTSY